MTMTSILLASVASSAIVAVPLLLHLSAVKAQRDLYYSWWERDSARAIVAEAQVDLTREQRRAAGRKSHEAERELIRETTDWLSSLPPTPLRPRHEIEAEVAAIRAARRETKPVAANPAAGDPGEQSAAPIAGGTGHVDRFAGQDTGAGSPFRVTQRVTPGNEPGHACRRNRAGYSAPAESSKAKGQ